MRSRGKPLFLWSGIALALAASPARESIVFAPDAGSAVTKRFRTELETGFADFSALLSGVEPEVPELTHDTRWTLDVTVRDEHVASEVGRPIELERAFEAIGYEIESEVTIDDQGSTATSTGTGTSPYEGKTVRFSWDAESESYARAWVGAEGDDELLAALDEDMDLRALLPESDVDQGDEWTVDVDAFLDTFLPGGGLRIAIVMEMQVGDPRLPVAGFDPRFACNLRDFLVGEASGKVTATFTGTRTEGERTVAVIEITADVETERDAEAFLRQRWGPEPAFTIDIEKASLALELEGDGELLWDVEAGRLHSYRFDGDVRLGLDEELLIEPDTESLEVECTLELEGKLGTRVTCE